CARRTRPASRPSASPWTAPATTTCARCATRRATWSSTTSRLCRGSCRRSTAASCAPERGSGPGHGYHERIEDGARVREPLRPFLPREALCAPVEAREATRPLHLSHAIPQPAKVPDDGRDLERPVRLHDGGEV